MNLNYNYIRDLIIINNYKLHFLIGCKRTFPTYLMLFLTKGPNLLEFFVIFVTACKVKSLFPGEKIIRNK
jgi:hypothetical protein